MLLGLLPAAFGKSGAVASASSGLGSWDDLATLCGTDRDRGRKAIEGHAS